MKWKDMIAMCLGNLMRRKVRTLLTTMGVVIGTCAIVVMVSLGVGLQQNMQESLAQMGDLTVITIYHYNQSKDQAALDDAMLDQFRKIPGVMAVTPIYNNTDQLGDLKSKKYQYSGGIVGVDFNALEALGYQFKDGEIPSGDDYSGIVLFGEEAVYQFYNPKSPNSMNDMYPQPDAQGNMPDPKVKVMEDKLEFYIRKNEEQNNKKAPVYKLKCAGILVSDWSKNPSPGYQVFMDVRYLKKLEAEYNKLNNVKKDKNVKESYQQAIVKVDSLEQVAEIEQQIKDMGFETNSMESIRKPMEEQAKRQQMILGGLGAISLLVAALGITNTMVMSIYERTREIGVMKVLGCVVGDIRTVFLMEAGAIGLLGGIIGVLLSYAISFIINFLSMQGLGGMSGEMGVSASSSVIPWWLVVGALVFSTLVGLVSGFSPANRAVKISALTAIKQE